MKYKTLVLLMLLTASTLLKADKIMVGNFSSGSLQGWQQKEFNGRTHYELKRVDNKIVLASDSINAASGLFKKVHINLNESPIIHWSWKIKNILQSNNEREKSGDDFAARIYIIFSDGPFFWQTKTLDYVWANHSKIGEHWPNPYTQNAHMFAIQSGKKYTNQWQTESRNILNDIHSIFGKNVSTIEAIAVMTDTDQTGAATQAWFGDIWFSDH